MLLAPLLASTLLALSGSPSPEDVASYREAKASAGRDAASQVKLALWCEAHGLDAERTEHLARAVLTDPANAAARGLLGVVADGARWAKPDDLAEKIAKDSELARSLAEYAERRTKAPRTAEGHWRLSLWCEERGLEAEARAHLVACVRLDPTRAAAWKRLGCKRVNGLWVTDEQVAARKAEIEAQQRADRTYKTQLAGWRSALRDKDRTKQFEAEKGLNSIKDPRAVSSVWRVFVLGGGTPGDLARAVQILGQIDSPASSRALALIALDGPSADLRRSAVETIARRDPRDYMGELIVLLRNELRYEVRPVGGPGSPGALFVEGEEFNRMRVYAPPAPSFVLVDTGSWATDAYGNEVIRVQGQVTERPRYVGKPGIVSGHDFRHGLDGSNPLAAPLAASLGPNPAQARFEIPTHLFKPGWGNANYFRDQDFAVAVQKTQTDTRATETTLPIGQIAAEYQKSALAAQEQLRQDVTIVEAENLKIRQRNNRVGDVLNNATSQALPARPSVWRPWWADQRGYAYVEPPAVPKPTMVENVPLAYTPQPIGATTQVGGVVHTDTGYVAHAGLTPIGIARASHDGLLADCFDAGTPVRTRTGPRPIESLEVGDHVLSQDTATGALQFKPVLAVFKFRPADTLKVRFGAEEIVTTGVHRFWKPGAGWVMARELKPGDSVRTLGGTVKVESVEPAGVRRVFNLEVADCADYFVGAAGLLAGDNTLTGTRIRPFDIAGNLSESTHSPAK